MQVTYNGSYIPLSIAMTYFKSVRGWLYGQPGTIAVYQNTLFFEDYAWNFQEIHSVAVQNRQATVFLNSGQRLEFQLE